MWVAGEEAVKFAAKSDVSRLQTLKWNASHSRKINVWEIALEPVDFVVASDLDVRSPVPWWLVKVVERESKVVML
jgi:hypothetical protein